MSKHEHKKKIVIVTPYLNSHTGGLENYVANIVGGLQRNGWEIVIITSNDLGKPQQKECIDGVMVYRLRTWCKISNTPLNPLWYFQIKNILKKEKPDIVNGHGPVPYIADMAALAAGTVPFVLTYHAGTMRKHILHLDLLIWLYEHVCLHVTAERAKKIICPSKFIINTLLKKYEKKSIVITPGVDTDFFVPPSPTQETETNTVLFIARFANMYKLKGLYNLVEAIKKIPHITLKVIGEPVRVDVPNVVFLGPKSSKEVVEEMQKSTLLVLPSATNAESFGMVLIEAMACAKPVVGTRSGGIPEVVEDGVDGVLVNHDDIDALAHAINRIVNDPAYAHSLGEHGYEKVTKHFQWQTKADETNTVLASVVRDNKPTVVCISAYYPPHMGGLEVVAKESSEELARQGYTVKVLTSRIGAEHSPTHEYAERYSIQRLSGIEVAHTPLLWSLPYHLFRVPKNSILHIHLAHALIPEIALLVAKLRTLRVVAHFHLDVGPSGRLGALILPVYKKYFLGFVLRHVDTVIVFSDEQVRLVRDTYRVQENNIVIIPNGVAREFFHDEVRPLPKDALKILFVGRLAVQKRVDRLLETMTKINFPAQLMIVGDGEDRDTLEAQARNLGLTNVSFEGRKSGEALRVYYRTADVFVSTSDVEGMPLVVLEAMAAGLPVVASNVLGLRELVGGTGVLVDNPSGETFARALENIWEHPEQLVQLSHQSLNKAREYTWGKVVERLKNLYQEIVEKKTTPTKEASLLLLSRLLRQCIPYALIALWWADVVLLSTTHFNAFQILNMVGFSFLVLVPGLLTLAVLTIKNIDVWAYIGLAVALSLFELMTVALIGNGLLPRLGIAHPLSRTVLLWEITVLLIVLFAVHARKKSDFVLWRPTVRFFDSTRDWLLALFPILFVVMSVLGAIRLNNGASGILTFCMLIGIGLYVAILTRYSKQVSKNVIPVALFFVSLSLLFMTSLRGWFTTGHDIQNEYFVFELTKNSGIWSVAAFRDAYNACLSITILPTIFANILKVADPYVYKVFLQIVFAIVPGILYITVRKYTSNAVAFLAVFFFISFPTFFGDMPMLVRQEVAFVFWALMIYLLNEEYMSVALRRTLFVVLGFGMVLSHYSTTYTVIALLLFLIVSRPLFTLFERSIRSIALFKKSAILDTRSPTVRTKPFVTLLMVALITFGSFLWSSVLTDTSSGSIYRVVEKTLETIRHNAHENTRSVDVLYSLFSWGVPDPENGLILYQKNIADPARESAPPGTYYDSPVYEKYTLQVVTDTNTQSGAAAINYTLKQSLAKMLQVLIMVGFLFTLFSSRFIRGHIDKDFFLLSAGSFLFVASQVLLPVLSAEYGVLRAFEQSLMFLGMFVVIGSLGVGLRLPNWSRVIIAVLFALVFFYSMTGVITQVLTKSSTQLHLINSGVYYDAYYTHATELQASSWLEEHLQKGEWSDVQTDHSERNEFRKIKNINLINGIYPRLIQKNAYVFLGYANVHKERSTVLWNSDVIVYTYPIQFLDENKNRIYSNGDVSIYR